MLKISPESANSLEAPFTEKEVRKVVFDMPSDRAPGPDGFSGLFYKECWDIIAKDLMAVMNALHEGRFHSFGGLNSSIITLLAKKDVSLQLGDFRPINLIHGVAKIFAKVLAVRLKPLLPELYPKRKVLFSPTEAYTKISSLFGTLLSCCIIRRSRRCL